MFVNATTVVSCRYVASQMYFGVGHCREVSGLNTTSVTEIQQQIYRARLVPSKIQLVQWDWLMSHDRLPECYNVAYVLQQMFGGLCLCRTVVLIELCCIVDVWWRGLWDCDCVTVCWLDADHGYRCYSVGIIDVVVCHCRVVCRINMLIAFDVSWLTSRDVCCIVMFDVAS